MRTFLSLFLLTLFAFSLHAQDQPRITADEVLDHITFLASDSLKGRKPGTPESDVAAAYLRDQFRNYGLKPLADNGFQHFELITDVSMGENNRMEIDGETFTPGEDYTPLSFSENATVQAPAVFVGYGMEINNDSLQWNDYSDLDVSGKWAVILRGMPADDDPAGVFAGNVSERIKVMVARDKGAAGVIFVSGPAMAEEDVLMKMTYDKSAATAGIPVLQAKRSAIDAVISTFGKSVANAESRIKESMSPMVFSIPAVISATTDVEFKKAVTQNVVAMLEGSHPQLKDEFVLVGAHFDHLGFGGPGSGSRAIDTMAVHYGADDNASGVAGVLELAQKFASMKGQIDRSLIFAAFGAEEMGLIGSKFFVENSPVNIEKVVAMINFDMIGRLKDARTVSVGGTGTAAESENILDRLGRASRLSLKYSSEGYGPSDHAAFYSANIPVFFISTGAHEDYHTPKDRVEFINAWGQVEVLKFAQSLVEELANRDDRLTFQEAGPKNRARQGYNFKVTLGIMPDFTSSENDGLGVDGVRPDGPADMGGLEKGDKIVAIDGKPITNIYDYMGRLKKLEAGQTIAVDVMRNEKKKVLIIQL
ncbi:MAG: M20/M25/M40 family metallo-hydrolase [Bacteroidales bacterium]